jgi:Protein of unknown function (DUF3224)
MSTTTAKRLLALTPIAALLAVICVTAAASQPATATGTFTYLASTFNGVRFEGGNTIIDDLHATVSYTGTLSGTSTLQGKLILHADGTANFHDIETFTGTVAGVPGSVTLRLEGATNPNGVVNATDTVLSSTGALANLHGVLDLVGTVPNPSGPVGTYSGWVRAGN